MSKKGKVSKMKRLFWFWIGFMLVFGLGFSCNARAEKSIALFGGVHNGHSWSGDNKIDPPGYLGHFAGVRYEDREKEGFFKFIRLSYGGSVTYLRYGKRNNDTFEERWNQAIMGKLEGTAYLDLYQGASLFAGAGVGAAAETDGVHAVGSFRYGIEKSITDKFSAGISGEHLVSSVRRHDLYGVYVKYSF